MAATDTFEQFNKALTGKDLGIFENLAKATTVELFAARSEDARNRIVEEYIRQVHNLSARNR